VRELSRHLTAFSWRVATAELCAFAADDLRFAFFESVLADCAASCAVRVVQEVTSRPARMTTPSNGSNFCHSVGDSSRRRTLPGSLM
jgi:hypothetical protein